MSSNELNVDFLVSTGKGVLKNASQLLALSYILLICLGYIHQLLFYSQFGIDIIDYVTVTELIFLFVPVGGVLLLPSILIVVIVVTMMVMGSSKFETKSQKKEVTYNSDAKSTKDWPWLGQILNVVIVVYLPILLVILALKLKLFKTWNIDFILLTTTLWMLAIFLKMGSTRLSRDTYKYFKFFLIVPFVCGFVIVVEFLNIKDAQFILEGQPEYQATLTVDKGHITTDDCIMYVGQTTNYVFLRDIGNDYNLIYPKSDIHQFAIKKIIYPEEN